MRPCSKQTIIAGLLIISAASAKLSFTPYERVRSIRKVILALRGGLQRDEDVSQKEKSDSINDQADEQTRLGGGLINEEGVLELVVQDSSDQAAPPVVSSSEDDDTFAAASIELLENEEEQELAVQLQIAQEKAAKLRRKGKELHDAGSWQLAADLFFQASQLLLSYTNSTSSTVALQEFSTCRLHEALCQWKQGNHEASVEACSDVLAQASELPPIRARALYRRAKAKLGLKDTVGALEDARSSAFLGDRKAVAMYGTLMRDDPKTLPSVGEDTSPPMLQDLFQGKNPFMPSSDTTSSSSNALLDVLLNKSGGLGGSNPMQDMLLSNLGAMNNKNGGGLAKSVIKSLTKRLEREESQITICQYLKNTNAVQIRRLAGMGGIPLSQDVATRIESFCHGVTPAGIRRSVRMTRMIWYLGCLIQSCMQLLSKYRQLVILWALVTWIKSAIQRPIPVNKRRLNQP